MLALRAAMVKEGIASDKSSSNSVSNGKRQMLTNSVNVTDIKDTCATCIIVCGV